IELFDIFQRALTEAVTGVDQHVSVRDMRDFPVQAVAIRDADQLHGKAPGKWDGGSQAQRPSPWRTEGPAVTCRAFFLVSEGPSWLEPRSYASNIEIGYCQGVLLDELAAGFHVVAHQGVEDLVGGDGVVDGALQHAAV